MRKRYYLACQEARLEPSGTVLAKLEELYERLDSLGKGIRLASLEEVHGVPLHEQW